MKKLIKYMFIMLLLSMLVVGTGSYVYLHNISNINNTSPIFETANNNSPKTSKENRALNIVILGVDHASKDDKGRSDTLIFMSYDPSTKRASLISIPRDTRVYLDKYGYQKINAAYAFYGPERSAQEVSKILGVPVDYYVLIDFQGFKKLVDDLGGIDFDVPVNMNYDDPAQNLHIHLKKGMQHLNGEQALGLVRYRYGYADADLGRIKTQQKFLKVLFDKIVSPSSIFKAGSLYDLAVHYVKTDMPTVTILSYIDDLFKVNKDDIKMETLPGEPQYIGGISYFIYDEAKTREMVANLNKPQTDNAIASDTSQLNPATIKVEVLNGGGITGAATRVAGMLEEYGYDVINIANAKDMNHVTTQIINRTQNKAVADNIKGYFKNSVVIDERPTDNKPDITIIVGSDYNND
ncbi:LCP family protein [Caldanaerobius polysaccharolyticus]|uniref:LCP family protein n=1 Tax=Caldanaerobius polysaccharolyticus TaxID=44256 RepID=UPI000479E441|nr:LCP family protein [Caldanaerobius polysaccharolyticus]